jgi:hypothetical protein
MRAKAESFFNPPAEHHLWATAVFRWCLAIPLLLATSLAVIAGCNEFDRALPIWKWNGSAYTEFLKLHKLPLGVLASLIPLLALVAANHRSVQSAANLRAQLANNAFTNYYKHLEEFQAFASGVHDEIGKDINTRVLHRNLYPHMREGNAAMAPVYLSRLARLEHAAIALRDFLFEKSIDNELIASYDSAETTRLNDVWQGNGHLLPAYLNELHEFSKFMGRQNEGFYTQSLEKMIIAATRRLSFLVEILAFDTSQEAMEHAGYLAEVKTIMVQVRGHAEMKRLRQVTGSTLIEQSV